MAKTIWKFPIVITDLQTVPLPDGAKVLTVAEQRGDLCLWAEVNPDAPKVKRTFEVFGTGHPMHTDMGVERGYVGTAQTEGGSFVWHVYERLN